jgi:hypothetical protein
MHITKLLVCIRSRGKKNRFLRVVSMRFFLYLCCRERKPSTVIRILRVAPHNRRDDDGIEGFSPLGLRPFLVLMFPLPLFLPLASSTRSSRMLIDSHHVPGLGIYS